MDERRLPGYFTARDVGAAENGMHGFSAMNNIIAVRSVAGAFMVYLGNNVSFKY